MENKFKHIAAIPASAGKVQGMTVFDNAIILACEFAVFIVKERGMVFDRESEVWSLPDTKYELVPVMQALQ